MKGIYPLETLKVSPFISGKIKANYIQRQTQMMSNTGIKRSFAQAMRQLYSMGGVRAYYRGLTVSLSFVSYGHLL